MKYDWVEIDQFIMDNAGKYTKTQICEKFNIKELSVLTRHIQRSCPELENYITKGFKEYDWTEIEQYIIDNAGKYTRRQICEKFNIKGLSVLNNHIQKSCPELKRDINTKRNKMYDWKEIDQYIIDNAGKYTRTQICEKFNITKMATLSNHIRESCLEFEKCFKDERIKYDWKEVDQYIIDNASKYTRRQICEKFNIKEMTLSWHIQRCCPELKNCFKNEHIKHDWKEIEQYIKKNVGKYTKTQICEKFNIKYISLYFYIRDSCPELNKCFICV